MRQISYDINKQYLWTDCASDCGGDYDIDWNEQNADVYAYVFYTYNWRHFSEVQQLLTFHLYANLKQFNIEAWLPLFYWQKIQDFSRTYQDFHNKFFRTCSEPTNVQI